MNSEEPKGKAIGGLARAAALTDERKSEIAKKGAEARWKRVAEDGTETSSLPRATHSGVLNIGGEDLSCYVLENGERILSTRAVMKSLKRTWRGRKYGGTELPVFLEAKNLKTFISNDLSSVLTSRQFRTETGAKAEGYVAEVLPAVCDVYLQARMAGALTGPQLVVAQQCEILVRGLANLGIVALVDEATGYQEVRDRQALRAILDKYLRKELAAWAKRFPDDFYKEMFRLRGWPMNPMQAKRPGAVGTYTNNLVYERLAPGILDELQKRNPKDEKGNRKGKHHQLLTDEVGHPALAQHLYAIIGAMRAHSKWDDFIHFLDRAYPKRNATLELALDNPNATE